MMSAGRIVTATVLFTDVVESTVQRIALGDDAADDVAIAHDGRLRAEVARCRGRVVKALGDGIMAIFDSATDAVSAAVAIQQLTRRENRAADEDRRIVLRVGLSAGDVQQVDDDYHGTPIVEAKRLEAAARPGQILVSEKVRSLVGSRGNYGYARVGELDLKGLPERIVAYAVNWTSEADAMPKKPGPPPGTEQHRRLARPLAVVSGVVVLLIAAATFAFVEANKRTTGHSPLVVSRPTTYTPLFESAACPPRSSASRCGSLVVPENRSKPHGRKIRLDVSIASTAPTGGAAPTIWLGGPSSGGVVSAGLASGDVVDFALRGWPGSTPVFTCPAIGTDYIDGLSLDQRDGVVSRAFHDRYIKDARNCHDGFVRDGIDLSAYTREASADDLRDLAFAMGWKQINIEAALSDSGIALTFARRYPALTRAVVIQDPIPPDDSEYSGLVTAAGAAWTTYVGECSANTACHSRFGNLTNDFTHLYDTLNAKPVTVRVTVPGGPNLTVHLDGDLMATTVIEALGAPAALPLIAPVVTSGNPNVIAGFIAQTAWFARTYPYGADFTGNCTYGLANLNRVQLEAGVTAFPEFRSLVQDPRFDVCAAWTIPGVSGASSVAAPDLRSPIAAPALIIEGALYPNSSPDWARSVGTEFRQATVVILPSLTSDPLDSGNQCLSQLRSTFLANPATALHPNNCIQHIPPIPFAGG